MTSDSADRVIRVVSIGGVPKSELLRRLDAAGVRRNEYAEALFADPRFVTAAAPSRVRTVELGVADLGLPDGGTFAAIAEQARALALSLCPLELGPHLRLQVMDQQEGRVVRPESHDRAPPGAITIASAPIAEDEDTPKGFYLRRMEGVLWLRAYRASADHAWSPQDRFVFATPGGAGAVPGV